MHKHRIVLGFDFGLRKIGVAVGQLITQTANPLEILKANRGVPDWARIQKLIVTWGADALIVGLPLNMDGTEQWITQRAREFGNTLREKCNLPIFFVDERLTTIAAKEIMHDNLKGAARFENADSVSAKLIIESWFFSQNEVKK
ncbi:MAG: Holliday junction resolvase RuvX [Gammaproteobacteria bacterium CG_4_10_14_0_8_um_filter_38_16]|nr:MAG: Holliday junction resolvase RuvX [Gammaproteobacteria bacterium CG_4_10_14_0_8_um_filter_38_16]PJA03220.1 MAG: Holliday junction resolvase RuvX [Gammaproteobacteria bacterium CG_4_10_14_0_2_um_filter_38_22]PJB10908.1 MAG: Holliday junction resolvase RuvX [Gammaproteobacteria bacterium CG_4_9_14_3_um_filter_38_9]